MNKTILHINTADNRKTLVSLKVSGKKYEESQPSADSWASQNLLPLIVKILRKHKKSLSDIDGIEVFCGPGSFTGLRVGTAVANMLGKMLDIPVNGKKDTQSTPVYG